MVNAAKLAGTFKLLSVEARIRIVQVLKRRALCVTELTSRLGITHSATSQHLRVLKDARIVKFQKRGLHVYYHLDVRNIARIQKATSKLFE
ncbi:MAG: ArsR/SmtB family transcription factor [Planctomycetota bacterium]|jgi:DNA-binding transcriptional ArsR family regulator